MSEQIPSSVGLGVLVNDDNTVLASGGFILQVMPGAKEETLQKIEANIKAMPPVSALIHDNFTPEMIVNEITKGEHEFVEFLDYPMLAIVIRTSLPAAFYRLENPNYRN
jgi:molecular chaperone Hsp33